MKTNKWLLIILAVVIVLAFVLFKKNDTSTVPADMQTTTSTDTDATTSTGKKGVTAPATVRLVGGLHGTTTVLTVGQKLIITTVNPTDAGYVISTPQYNGAILTLLSQTNVTTPQAENTWEFVASKSGTTGITISAAQGTTHTVTLFSGAISVK